MAVGCGALIGLLVAIMLGSALSVFLPSPITGIVMVVCIIGGGIIGPKVMNEPQSPEDKTEDDKAEDDFRNRG